MVNKRNERIKILKCLKINKEKLIFKHSQPFIPPKNTFRSFPYLAKFYLQIFDIRFASFVLLLNYLTYFRSAYAYA